MMKALTVSIAASAIVLFAQSAMADITTTLSTLTVTNDQSGNNEATVTMNSSANSAASAQAGVGNIDIIDGCCGSGGDLTTSITSMTVDATQMGNNTATVNMDGVGNLGSAVAGYGNIIIMRGGSNP